MDKETRQHLSSIEQKLDALLKAAGQKPEPRQKSAEQVNAEFGTDRTDPIVIRR